MKNHLQNLLIMFVLLLAAAGSGRAQTITSLSPTSGPAGTVVTINGTNLSGTSSVLLRGIPSRVTPISDTQVSFVVPGQASSGPVRLTTPGGTTLSTSSFIVTRTTPTTFTLRSDNFNNIDVYLYSAPTFTDLDGDGLLDMLVGEQNGNLNHYEQDAANSTTFTLVTTNFNGIDVVFLSVPTFTDLDGDGLLDLLVGEQNGNLNHYEQSASNTTSFTLVTQNFNGIDVGYDSSPTFTDLDGDGLLDMIVGNFGRTLSHYEQDAANSTSFTLVTQNFNGIGVGTYSAPAFTDLDSDGLLDLLVGEVRGNLNHYEQALPVPTVNDINSDTYTITNPAAGTYTITAVSNANGTGTASGSATVTINPIPDAPTLSASPASTTTNQPITVTASGCAGTLSWNTTGGTGVENGNQYTFSTPGSYSISATCTLDGCTSPASQTLSVTINACPTIDVGISGNTAVTFGYGSNCTTLTASASGGTAPYSYVWKLENATLGQSASQQLCPESTTIYTVTATDGNGCTGTQQVTVTVNDVRCGYGGVKVCLGGREQCIAQYLVPTYLRFGATIGGCNWPIPTRIGYELESQEPKLGLSLKAYPNPTLGRVKVEVQIEVAGTAQFDVLDLAGRSVEQRALPLTEGTHEVAFDLASRPAGNYLIRCRDGVGRQAVVRVNKQ